MGACCATALTIRHPPPSVEQATEDDKGHGRLEQRTAKVITDFHDWVPSSQRHLDVSFGQDANQTRTKYAAENLAVVRHFALNLARGYRGDRYSVLRRRRLCDYDVVYRETLLRASANLASS